MKLDNRVKMPALILKRASASRISGEWNNDDFDEHSKNFGAKRLRPLECTQLM
jgi:hypothetical protein